MRKKVDDFPTVQFLHRLAKWISPLVLEMETQGQWPLQRDQPLILMSNHISFVDWLVVHGACPRPLRFIISQQYYDMKLFSPVFVGSRTIPIKEGLSKKTDIIRSLHVALDALRAGEWVFIFPEGIISRNGELGEFKKGVEFIAKKSGAAILPLYIDGLWGSIFSRYPAGKSFSHWPGLDKSKVYLKIGETLPYDASVQEMRASILKLKEQS